MKTKVKVAVLGASGRMGRAIIRLLETHDELSIGAAVDRVIISPLISDDTEAALKSADVAIDFTAPDASVAAARIAADAKTPLVIGTTGLSVAQEAFLQDAAKLIPIVYSANMSIGVTVLAALTENAAAILGPEYDIDVLEMHHRHKVDAPSGTALLLGKVAAAGRGVALNDVRAKLRDGHTGPRVTGEIGFAVLRGGDVAGDHTVFFAGEGERLELTYRASDRAVFAHGALRAAAWVLRQPPGLYSMRDVLGL